MKRVSAYLLLVFFLSIPSVGFTATEGPYIAVGSTTFKYSGFKPSEIEKQFMSLGTGGYSTKNTSTKPELAFGYCFNRYFCGDASYTEIELETNTRLDSINAGYVTVNGQSFVFNGTTYVFNGAIYPLGVYDVNILFSRHLNASVSRLSVSGEYPLTERLGIIGRVGVYYWKAHVLDKLVVGRTDSVYLAYDEYDSGQTPMASVGLGFKFTNKISASIEYSRINQVTMNFARINFAQ